MLRPLVNALVVTSLVVGVLACGARSLDDTQGSGGASASGCGGAPTRTPPVPPNGCVADRDCSRGSVCATPHHAPAVFCAPCQLHCSDGYACDGEFRGTTCLEIEQPADCGCEGTQGVCSRACSNDRECGYYQGYRCTDGLCRPATCTCAADCDAGYACEGGLCTPQHCTSNAECATGICYEDFYATPPKGVCAPSFGTCEIEAVSTGTF